MKNLKLLLLIGITMFIVLGCSQDVTESDEGQKTADKKEKQVNKTAEKEEEIKKTEQKEKVEALYEINEANWALEPLKEGTNEEVVLLTIDDAPDKYALEMAETLDEMDIPAIFFVNGHFLETEAEKEQLKEIYDLGFVIGNHTYSHESLQSISESEQKDEIIRVNEQVEEITGEKPVFFRAPFGQNTDYSKELINSEGMKLMNWTYGYDWDAEYMTKESILDIMVNAPELNNGGNLLMHDREWTNEALAEIVTGLNTKGYDFIDPKTISGYEYIEE